MLQKSVYMLILILNYSFNIYCPAGTKNTQKALPSTSKFIKCFTVSLPEFLYNFKETEYVKLSEARDFIYNPFPVEFVSNHPYYTMSGTHQENFYLKIPNGIAFFDKHGLLYVNNCNIIQPNQKTWLPTPKEFWPWCNPYMPEPPIQKINGTVAILNFRASMIYGHFLFDLLGALALLEMNNVEYDYIYIRNDLKFMYEALKLWGIPEHKIIPIVFFEGIQATNIIYVSDIGRDEKLSGQPNYYPIETLQYTRSKLLQNIPNLHQITQLLPKKIFLSRQDAKTRRMTNETDFFKILEQHGYTKITASSLSFIEQIALFHNATHIIGIAGSNMANIMFAQPHTKYLEIMQSFVDTTFFAISQIFNIEYHCICEATFIDMYEERAARNGYNMNLKLIENFLMEHNEF